MFGKIAWNENFWNGWDEKGYKNKDRYGYNFVRKNGFGYEWWNFFDFGDEYFYGHVEFMNKFPKKFENGGLIAFLSKNIYDNTLYLVGFYGRAELSDKGFNAPKSRWDTLPKEVQSQMVDATIKQGLQDTKAFLIRADKKYSSIFMKPIKIDETSDLGTGKLGQASVIYCGENEKVKPEKIYRLFERALKEHEHLLNEVDEQKKEKVQSVIEKINHAINNYKSYPKRCWQIAPGESAKFWDICKEKGIINVGWNDVVIRYGKRLFEFHDRENLKEALREFYDKQRLNIYTNELWNFIKEVKVGDIVVANKGKQMIIGIGEIKSEPMLDLDLEFSIYRQVDWKYPDLNIQIVPELKGIFGWTIRLLKADEIEKLGISRYLENDLNDFGPFERLERILNSKKQVIIYGPPGTGKTYVSREFVKEKVSDFYERSRFVTFHQSYGYEEFIEGLRPVSRDGQISYIIEEGTFKRMCRDAFNALCVKTDVEKKWEEREGLPDLSEEEKQEIKNILKSGDFPRFYLVVDEINRGDISRIFGELITLLEADKRLLCENELIVILPNSKTKFAVPPNLYIIGTMNTADRSIALIDVALRRRFGFIELMPDDTLLEKQFSGEEAQEKVSEIRKLAVEVLKEINKRIMKIYDRNHQIGHSYFMRLKDAKTEEETKELLKEIWFFEIIPLLQEYFHDSPNKLKEVLGEDFFKDEDECYEIKDIDDINDEDFIAALNKLSGKTGEQVAQ